MNSGITTSRKYLLNLKNLKKRKEVRRTLIPKCYRAIGGHRKNQCSTFPFLPNVRYQQRSSIWPRLCLRIFLLHHRLSLNDSVNWLDEKWIVDGEYAIQCGNSTELQAAEDSAGASTINPIGSRHWDADAAAVTQNFDARVMEGRKKLQL